MRGAVSQLFSKSDPTGRRPWTLPTSAPWGVPAGPRGGGESSARVHPTLGALLPWGLKRGQWRSLVAHGQGTSPWGFYPPLETLVSKAQAGSGRRGRCVRAQRTVTPATPVLTGSGLIWW